MVNSAAIALTAVTLATYINSYGLILMKVALIKSESEKKVPYFRWQYILGFGFLILGAFIAVGKNSLRMLLLFR